MMKMGIIAQNFHLFPWDMNNPPKNNNKNNSKKQWRRKLAKIGHVREMLVGHIYSLSCMQVEVKNKQTNCK